MDERTQRRITTGGIAGLIAAILAWWRRRRGRAACCASDVGAWDDEPAWSGSGTMTNIASFATFVDDERPCWRYYPVASALALIGVDPTSSDPQETVTVDVGPSAGSGEVDVTLTYEDLKDDSVSAVRYRFTFVDGGFLDPEVSGYRLVAGLRLVRCQPGRGQQDWGTDLCL